MKRSPSLNFFDVYSYPFYVASNGVTIILKAGYGVGTTGKADGDVSGQTYTAVSEAQLRAMDVDTDDYTVVCTSLVTNMSSLFLSATAFNQDIRTWDVSNVTTMQQLFDGASSFNQPLNSWDVSNVTTMQQLFDGASSFNQPLNSWDVSNVTIMTTMFQQARDFNQPLNNWDLSSVTGTQEMFERAYNFNQPLNNWNVSNVTNMTQMFRNAYQFNQPINNWNVSQVTDMTRMLESSSLSAANLTSIYENWPQLTLQQNIPFSAGATKYNSSATAGRNTWINRYNGVLTDGGLV